MAWVLIWNPDEFDWLKHGFVSDYRSFAQAGYLDSTWSCGWIHSTRQSGPRPGGRFFGLKVGRSNPGLVGAGHFLTAPDRRHGTFKGAPLARIRYEYLADIREPRTYLPRPALLLLTGDTLRYPASGMPIEPDVAARLELILGMVRSVRTSGA